MPPPRQLMTSKWKKVLYPDCDPDHSQNLFGSKLDLSYIDSSEFFCNPAEQTNGQTVNKIISIISLFNVIS